MNEKNNEVIDLVESEEGNAMVPANNKEKAKTIGKKVGKVLLAGTALVVAFCLGKRAGKRSCEDDYDYDVIDLDSDMEDDE